MQLLIGHESDTLSNGNYNLEKCKKRKMSQKPAFSSFIGFSRKNLKIGRCVGVGIMVAHILQKTVSKSDLN